MKHDSILTIPGSPVPYAVLGFPVHHSFSPIMQQAAFDHLGIEARYFRIEVDETKLDRAIEHLRLVPFGGWNCTVPNKVRMLELCDRKAESAERFQAVNTVVNEQGTLIGHNTDGYGWSRALQEAFATNAGDLRILLLGAGGAARAIATQTLLEKCPRLLIANRKVGRARELVDQLRTSFSGSPLARTETDLQAISLDEPTLERALGEVDLVVNATSSGLQPDQPPILPAHLISPRLLVFDTIYGAGCQKLQREVETAQARWSDGLGMLLHQGAAAFSLWTGRDAPIEIMRSALQSVFSASRGS